MFNPPCIIHVQKLLTANFKFAVKQDFFLLVTEDNTVAN